MKAIREHLTELKTENIEAIRKKMIKFFKKDLPIQQKYFALYFLILHSYFTFFDEEIRVMEYEVFISKLTEYYNEQNCDVEFVITSKHEWIKTYKVRQRNKCYYYDKLEGRGGFKELRKIFFPDEDIRIKAIQRVDTDGDRIRLHIEKNNINKHTMSDFF